MRSLLFLLLPSIALAQGAPSTGLYPNTPITTGSQTVNGTVSSLGAPTTTYVVDHALGNDSNSCTSGSVPCKTIQGACNKIPGKRIAGGINIVVDGGTYPEGGCFLEGFTFENGANPSGGAYLRIAGVPIQSAASGLMSGTVTSATALVNFITLPTVTVTGAGWTVNALRGDVFSITGGAGAGEWLMISSNTATIATMAGSWPNGVTPDATSTFQIQDPCAVGGPVIDGGVGVPVSAQYFGTTAANTWANPSAFVVENNGESARVPDVFSSQSTSGQNLLAVGGGITIEGLCATVSTGVSTGFEFATVRNSNGVVLRGNKLLSLVPASRIFISSDGDRFAALGNYGSGSSSVETAMIANPGFSGHTVSTAAIGNVTDNLEYGDAYIGTVPSLSVLPVTYLTLANVVALGAASSAAFSFGGGCAGCSLAGDQVSGTNASGNACVSINGSWSSAWMPGSANSMRVRGGSYNGCLGGGFRVGSGANVFFAGTAAQPTSGTAGAFGIDVRSGGFVALNANGSATVTGSTGDTTLDGTNAISYPTLNTAGMMMNLLSGSRLSMGSGAQVAGSLLYNATTVSNSTNDWTLNSTLNLTRTLNTCAAGIEGTIEQDATGGIATGAPTKLCVCRSNGSSVYVWQNLESGGLGTTTTCPSTPANVPGAITVLPGSGLLLLANTTKLGGFGFLGCNSVGTGRAFTMTAANFDVTTGGGGGAGTTVATVTDGTNTCTFTLPCGNAPPNGSNAAGTSRIAAVNGAGTGCAFPASACTTWSVTTGGCTATQPTGDFVPEGSYQ